MEAIEERAPAREWEPQGDAERHDASGEVVERPAVTIKVVADGEPSSSPRASDIDVLYPEWSFG